MFTSTIKDYNILSGGVKIYFFINRYIKQKMPVTMLKHLQALTLMENVSMSIYTNPFQVIYKITNHATNKVYIGSTLKVYNRHSDHIRNLLKNKHHNKKLQNAWNKYKPESFSFQVIEFVEFDTLLIKERQYVDIYDSVKNGYNIKYPEVRNSGNGLTREEISEEKKKYYINNRENILKKKQKYHQDNKENILKKKQEYRNENKDMINEKNRERRNLNKDQYNEYCRNLRKNNEEYKQKQREWHQLHKEELNIKKKERYNLNKDEINRKRRERKKKVKQDDI